MDSDCRVGWLQRMKAGLAWRLRAGLAVFGQDPRHRPQVKRDYEMHGNEYGGYAVVPRGLGNGSVVYSFGIGEDVSFDLSLMGKYGVSVFAFDPTPRSVVWLRSQTLPSGFRHFECALGARDGTAVFYAPRDPLHVSHSLIQKRHDETRSVQVPVKRLETIARELGHRRIDILKMDIEGAEYEIIRNLGRTGLEIPQIVLEFHHRDRRWWGRYQTSLAVRRMNRCGYRIFYVAEHHAVYGFIRD